MTSSLSIPKILVHEWVTGGGLAHEALPTSLATEGRAIRRAIAGDFAALNGGRAEVVVTLDHRLDADPGPWTTVRIGVEDHPRRVFGLAREADFTVLIAPETTRVLETMTDTLLSHGSRLLGSSRTAVALTADKTALAEWLMSRGIATPPCRKILAREKLPADASYPAVLKPNDGAGSTDTFFIKNHQDPLFSADAMAARILQPHISGRPMSVSYLVDARGRAWPLAIGEQDIAVVEGRFVYRGGRIPAARVVDERPMRAAVESVPGLRGYVGVDFVWDEEHRRSTVIEINPRPTTSIVGLVRLLPPGRLASAWMAAMEPSTEGEEILRSLADVIGTRSPVAFDACETIPVTGGHP